MRWTFSQGRVFAFVEVQTEEMIFLVFMYVFDIIMEIAGEELEQSW